MTKRPIEFKIRVLELREHHGKTPTEAFAQAGEEFKVSLSGCMTKYASGYIRDVEMEIKTKLWNHDVKVWKLCGRAKLYGADGITQRGFHFNHLQREAEKGTK
jgi:hypothetical protein